MDFILVYDFQTLMQWIGLKEIVKLSDLYIILTLNVYKIIFQYEMVDEE